MDVMPLLRRFRVAELKQGGGPLVVVIVSGHAGSLCTTFRDASHQMYVTDFYLDKAKTTQST